MQQLKEQNSERMHLQGILTYIKRDFSHIKLHETCFSHCSSNLTTLKIQDFQHLSPCQNVTVDEVTEAIKIRKSVRDLDNYLVIVQCIQNMTNAWP